MLNILTNIYTHMKYYFIIIYNLQLKFYLYKKISNYLCKFCKFNNDQLLQKSQNLILLQI